MVVTQTINPRYELYSENVKLKQIQSDNRKCDRNLKFHKNSESYLPETK